MRFVSLLSGGKDSIYNTMECIRQGHVLVAVLNLQTPGEKDSYMFQYVGNHIVKDIAECLGVPLVQIKTLGVSLNKEIEYTKKEGDEIEDLFEALKQMHKQYSFEGIASGAIGSSYQKNRVENICHRLGKTSLSYLWGRNQKELLSSMVKDGVHAIVVKAGEYPLDTLVGQEISQVLEIYGAYVQEEIAKSGKILKEEDFNICGEGGEYETLTLDCPIFTKKIQIINSEIVKDKQTRVSVLDILSHKVVEKDRC